MSQKSHEKNLALEEVWRRNEANMRRKQTKLNTQAGVGAGGSPDGQTNSPATGAMDSLLEKLRAAAPATRDTRDRRRRARLKDKHQVRIASGQKIPETGENATVSDETGSGRLSPKILEEQDEAAITAASSEGVDGGGNTSEGEDIADRAASLLQGLRRDGEGGGEGLGPSESLRVRRRREGADEERQRRRERRRRGGAAAAADANASASPPPQQSVAEQEKENVEAETTPAGEEAEVAAHYSNEDKRSSEDGEEQSLPTPTPRTVIVPPSPTASETQRTEDDAE